MNVKSWPRYFHGGWDSQSKPHLFKRDKEEDELLEWDALSGWISTKRAPLFQIKPYEAVYLVVSVSRWARATITYKEACHKLLGREPYVIGLASVGPEKRQEIAAKGGKAAHQKGTAHEWTSQQARDAGIKGGKASARKKRTERNSMPLVTASSTTETGSDCPAVVITAEEIEHHNQALAGNHTTLPMPSQKDLRQTVAYVNFLRRVNSVKL